MRRSVPALIKGPRCVIRNGTTETKNPKHRRRFVGGTERRVRRKYGTNASNAGTLEYIFVNNELGVPVRVLLMVVPSWQLLGSGQTTMVKFVRSPVTRCKAAGTNVTNVFKTRVSTLLDRRRAHHGRRHILKF